MTLKIAATLSLLSALSLISYGPAQSAPLSSVSAAVKQGADQADTLQVRWRRGWHIGGGNTFPDYYGGSYLGYTYGGFPGYAASGCEFPCFRPWVWYRPHYYPWY
jgi:hypothetical protein